MDRVKSIQRNYTILVINKIDKLDDKNLLLPFIEEIDKQKIFADIVPISALKIVNVDGLIQSICNYLPEGDHLFPSHQVTDISERFLTSEIIREKCINRLGDERLIGLASQ